MRALVAVWIAAILLVDPRADVPLIDDWTYAMSVERLLAGRGFQVASWSSTFPPAQIAWGGVFAGLGGFSFTVLRVSTLVLAVLGTLAFYALARALGCGRERALAGALTLAVYPVVFVLSFTFMTDVAMLTAMIASLWAIVTGLGEGEWRLEIELGLALAVVAFLVRPVAIALPLALLVTAAVRPATPRRGRAILLAVATLAVMALATMIAPRYWPQAAMGEGGLLYRLGRLRYVLLVSPLVYAEALLSMLAHLGLAVLPALVATAPPVRRWPYRTALVLVVAALAVSAVAPQQVAALKPHATWSTEELGGARPLLVGAVPYGGVRMALGLAATLAGLVAAACLLARVTRGFGPGGVLRSPAGTYLVAFAGISMALCFALWFFYDRYYLPLVPAAIALVLIVPEPSAADASVPFRHRVLAGALLAALFVLDVTGTRDMLAHARAVDAALARLVAAGVPWREVDAGYAENGWHLYAHPENLPPGTDVDREVPHVTGAADLPYVIANTPVRGYAVRETVPVASHWAATDRVYVLERMP
jgi:hypothetical protein